MPYFTKEDHALVASFNATNTAQNPSLEDKFARLFKSISTKIESSPMHLATSIRKPDKLIAKTSVTNPHTTGVLAGIFGRTNGEALNVERLMGREGIKLSELEARRHPVIEFRLQSDYVAVELIVSPDAWWDQQNLAGKLSVTRHRTHFYELLGALKGNFRLGFWQGIDLNDMNLTTSQFQSVHFLNEWMNTFQPAKDYFRIGAWHTPEAEAIRTDFITNKLFEQIKALYPFYEEFLWAGDNNYRSFYNK